MLLDIPVQWIHTQHHKQKLVRIIFTGIKIHYVRVFFFLIQKGNLHHCGTLEETQSALQSKC